MAEKGCLIQQVSAYLAFEIIADVASNVQIFIYKTLIIDARSR